jgi:hypothetical protein
MEAGGTRQDPPDGRNGSHRNPEASETREVSLQTDHQVPPKHMDVPDSIHYSHPFPVQRGDWVIRLRQDDPSAIPLEGGADTWDGPFQILEGPDPKSGCVQLRFPAGSKATRITDVRRLLPIHPVPQIPSLGIFHPEKGTSIYVDMVDSKPKPKSKKTKTTFIVDRIRGKRVLPNGELKYLVHWAGWPSEDDTWESADGIPPLLLEQYEEGNPPSVRHRRVTPEKKQRRSQGNSENEGAAAARASSPEAGGITSLVSRSTRSRTQKRKAAAATVPASTASFEPYEEGRRRTRNSGFIEYVGV